MSYVGNVPTTAAFPFDQFSGNGSTTAFTLSYAPAGTTSIIVSISGVVQNPNTYSVSGTTLTFTPAPPTGTNNIAVLYLGLPVVATLTPGNTAYFSSSVFTATQGQTVFTPSGTYQTGFINVIRNGAQLAPANYTATNGTTVTLANACTAGDIVVIEVFNLTSIAGALPVTGGTVTGATTFNSTVQVNGANVSGFTGFKNRIINPGMMIDQRNNGAAVTVNSASNYTLDRYEGALEGGSTGRFTVQRSTTAPAGFINSALLTVTTTATPSGTNYYLFQQKIEGFNMADFAWGTASASTVTVSFWIRGSVTGTYPFYLLNGAANVSYVSPFTINAANTWEYKTIVVPGPTSGTWATDNSVGMYAGFGLGAPSGRQATANTWTSGSSFFITTAGAVNFISNSGATLNITGVQLERGSNATSFEFRSYGQELALCQRYYYLHVSGITKAVGIGSNYASTEAHFVVSFKTSMRSAPTLVQTTGSAYYQAYAAGAAYPFSSFTLDQATTEACRIYAALTGAVAGQANYTITNNASSSVAFSAEL